MFHLTKETEGAGKDTPPFSYKFFCDKIAKQRYKFKTYLSLDSLAGRPGFEPRLLGPEPRVLPLNYPPSSE